MTAFGVGVGVLVSRRRTFVGDGVGVVLSTLITLIFLEAADGAGVVAGTCFGFILGATVGVGVGVGAVVLVGAPQRIPTRMKVVTR